jgi:hypothetical protein
VLELKIAKFKQSVRIDDLNGPAILLQGVTFGDVAAGSIRIVSTDCPPFDARMETAAISLSSLRKEKSRRALRRRLFHAAAGPKITPMSRQSECRQFLIPNPDRRKPAPFDQHDEQC